MAPGSLGIWKPGNLAICRVHPRALKADDQLGANGPEQTVTSDRSQQMTVGCSVRARERQRHAHDVAVEIVPLMRM